MAALPGVGIPIWREPKLGLELADLLRSRTWRGDGVAPGAGQPVLLIPGFLAGDDSLKAMEGWLTRMGYKPARSGIRSNIDCSERTIDRLAERLVWLARRHRRPVVIIGHSRGGLLARVLAVRHPDKVAGVITLGSPHLNALGDIHPLLKLQVEVLSRVGRVLPGVFSDSCKQEGCCERFWADLAGSFPRKVGFLSVYSRADGVVGWRSCLDPRARQLEVQSTHCGMAVNRHVFRSVARELERLAGASRRRAQRTLMAA